MNKGVLILIALTIPPLSVYLKRDAGKDLLLNLVLCTLIYIPGVIHAFWVALDGTEAADGSILLSQ